MAGTTDESTGAGSKFEIERADLKRTGELLLPVPVKRALPEAKVPLVPLVKCKEEPEPVNEVVLTTVNVPEDEDAAADESSKIWIRRGEPSKFAVPDSSAALEKTRLTAL